MGAKPLAMNRRQMVRMGYAAHQDTIGNSCLSHKPAFDILYRHRAAALFPSRLYSR